jgi:hypothetical protein
MSSTNKEEYEETTQKVKLDAKKVEEQSLAQDVPLLDELHHLWVMGEMDDFFNRLSRAVSQGKIDDKILEYIHNRLKGKVLEKALALIGDSKSKVKLSNSVGRGGTNLKIDVKLVQTLLNKTHINKKNLKVDGSVGAKTIATILKYQRSVVGLAKPDGKIDVDGKTFRMLLLNSSPVKSTASNIVDTIEESDTSHIKFGNSAKRIVSKKSLNVINKAVEEAGMDGAMITSTIRSPERQAKIMYKYASINLESQKKLYGATGDKVLTVFEANLKKKSKDEVIKMMAKRIEELSVGSRRVSRHCVSPAQYSRNNVIDIGVHSTKAVAGATFDQKAFTSALRRLENEGFIEKFIDETKKADTTWHVEIKQ